MAQKDIQDLANYMESLEQEDLQYKEACEEAAKEAAEAIEEEFDAFEDEVIDKASLGFIDDADANEADDFYAENDADTFEEDVSDCVETEQTDIDESVDTGYIVIEVFNEDGYGEHFIDELTQAVPQVTAVKGKNKTAQGDLIIKVYGKADDLKKAFAFWTGNKDFNALPQDDKDLFDSILVFDNGDTVAEADYREAVAHCLDPIGVNASTANLVGKDSCALTMVQEEKAKRSAKKMLKALKENDFSSLSDKDLNTLDNIQTALDNGSDYKDLTAEERKVLEVIAKNCGYSLNDWLKLSPEKREKIIADYDERMKISPTGFTDIHTRKRPDGTTEYYRNGYYVDNPETGEKELIHFNPYYTADDSVYQHPSMVNKQAKKRREAEEQAERTKRAKDAMKSARGKETWAISEFHQMIQNLDAKQRKNLMNAMIADVEEENSDPAQAGREIALIKTMFGKKLTSRDIAKMWNKSHLGVQKFADNMIGDLYVVARKMTGIQNGLEALGRILTGKPEIQKKFAEEFEKFMNAKPLAKRDPMDPEREQRKVAGRAAKTNA